MPNERTRESMVDCLRDQLIPPASLLVSRRGFSRAFSRAWKPGDEPVGLAEPGNQETSRWDPAGHADNQPWITFLTRELFIRNIFISYNK